MVMACRIAERVKLEGGIEKFFEGGYASGWFFKVSDAFMGQLDIAETLKGATAGTCYSFEAGDIFYDSSAAYEMPWGEAVRAVSCALRVTDAVPSSIVVDEVRGEDGEAKKLKRIADGRLVFEIVGRGADGALDFSAAREVECDQFEFAGLLRTGELPRLGIFLGRG